MLGRYSLLGGSIYKSKLNDFVFYSLKPVKLHVACSPRLLVIEITAFNNWSARMEFVLCTS